MAREEGIRIKSAIIGGQMSLYLSEKPSAEGAADTTLRAYLDGGVRVRSDDSFFEISTKHGEFRSDEILVSTTTEAQNIFSGILSEVPSAMYFIPSGWRTYSWCCLKCKPLARIGNVEIKFGEDERIEQVENADGKVQGIGVGPSATMTIGSGSKTSIISGKKEFEADEIILAVSAAEGETQLGPSVLIRKEGSKAYKLFMMKDKPDIELELAKGGASQLPVDEKHPLLAKPENFDEVLTVYYWLPKAGKARIEIFDMSGTRKQKAIDEKTAAGGHEVRVDCRKLPAGNYKLKFFIDDKLFEEKPVTRKFELSKPVFV